MTGWRKRQIMNAQKEETMNRKQITQMAREAGLFTHKEVQPEIERFAALVAAAERKEILDFASSEAFNRQHGEQSPYAYELANAIRARGNT